MKQLPISLYTDGGYSQKVNRGGYAAISQELKFIVCGNSINSTNNQMELMAAIRGLELLDPNSNVIVYSDSRYVVDAISKYWLRNWEKNNWKTKDGNPVKNKEYWLRLKEAISRHKKVKFEWVKGHSGNTYNEAVDELATVMKNYKGN